MSPRPIAIVATAISIACLAGCPSPAQHPVPPRPAASDAPLRIQIARAEARRGGGLAELVALATTGTTAERVLALRGLGRIGGARALEVLRAALTDATPEVVAAAAGGIGVAASLDEAPGDPALTAALLEALARAGGGDHAPAIIEALGRAGDASAQATLAGLLSTGPAASARAAAIALGRHGRRKISLSADARASLVGLSGHLRSGTYDDDAEARYAAIWALAREHEPPPPEPGAGPRGSVALASRLAAIAIDDPVAEIRAQAISALGRRKLVGDAGGALEHALLDRDWRVAVEAVRALTGESGTDDGRDAVAAALARRFVDLERGATTEAHVVIEALRGLAPHVRTRVISDAIAKVGAAARASAVLPALERHWIDCWAYVANARGVNLIAREPSVCPASGLPEHLRLPLFAQLIHAKVGSLAERRQLLRTLLAHDDPRVRAAGIGALGALWPDGDAADHRATVATLVAALASSDPVLAGSATEAAPAIYKAIDGGDRTALDVAIVTRARSELDPELGASLLGLIGSQQIAAGVDACRDGLGKHPVLARAAASCLRQLGATADPPGVAILPPPPNVDVASVIGKAVRWRVTTTRGEIVIALRPDVAPWAVATIVALTRRGYYDNLAFHRVVPGFVVQGGDPTQSGWGGPGFTIPAEPSGHADGRGFVAGGVGIADAGRDSGGSQWFVMHARAPHLDGRYTWFGAVESGHKSADALLIGDRVIHATVELAP